MENVQQNLAETAPLLNENSTGEHRHEAPPNRQPTWRSAWRAHLDVWSTMYIVGLLIILVDMPTFMADVPKLRMLELGLCRKHYLENDPSAIGGDGSISEHLCKIEEVQSSLAKTRGVLGMIEGIPGLLLAIPYGVLADAKGKRLVAGMSLVAFVLRDLWTFMVLYCYETFPLAAVFAGPAFLVLGGGSVVISPLLMAIIAAAIPEASRTRAFFWVRVTLLVTELVAPPLGAALMDAVGPHYAFLVAVPIEALALLMLGFLPNSKTARWNPDHQEEDHDENAQDGKMAWGHRGAEIVSQMSRDVKSGVKILGSRSGLLIGLLALVVSRMARPLLELILQYMSVRFKWPLARTSFLLSLQAAVQILLFVFILPRINVWLLSKLKSSAAANVTLVRGSVMILTIGTLCMAFAPSPPTFVTSFFAYTLGNGFSTALWSLMTTMVPPDHLSLLCTAIAVFEGISVIGASPLLGLSFSWGLNMGGFAVTLPFFIAATLYALAAGLIFVGMPIRID